MDIPNITLDARDIHAPGVLKSLAAKHRGTNPAHADLLDKIANGFEVWRRANPGVR